MIAIKQPEINKILSQILTTARANEIKSLLDSYAKEDLYRTMDNYYDYFLSLFNPELGKVLVESMAKADVDGENKEDLKNYALSLFNILSDTLQINVTTAIKVNEPFLQQLFVKFAEIFTHPVLLNMSYEPDILGGFSVVYKGRYVDMTLKNILDKYFVDKGDYVESLLQ